MKRLWAFILLSLGFSANTYADCYSELCKATNDVCDENPGLTVDEFEDLADELTEIKDQLEDADPEMVTQLLKREIEIVNIYKSYGLSDNDIILLAGAAICVECHGDDLQVEEDSL